MRAIPTDERLLRAIYKRYLDSFSAWSGENRTRATKVWVPVDIEALAKRFRCDEDLIFGRLYYHLNDRYGAQGSPEDRVSFFSIRVGQDRHCVNFPLLASVLADLQDQRKRFIISTRLAGLSLVISAISILIAVYR